MFRSTLRSIIGGWTSMGQNTHVPPSSVPSADASPYVNLPADRPQGACLPAERRPADGAPDSPQASGSAKAEALLRELELCSNTRMDTVQKGWEDMIIQKQAWDNKVHAAIQELERHGLQDEVVDFKSTLLAHNLVSHPHDFQVIWNTRFGQETVTVIFQAKSLDNGISQASEDKGVLNLESNREHPFSTEESDIEYLHSERSEDESGSESDTSADPIAFHLPSREDDRRERCSIDPAREGRPSTTEPVTDPTIALKSSLTEPVKTLGFVPKVSCNIRLGTQRVFIAKLGFAFYIDCPCDRIFVPSSTTSTDPSEATHDILSPIFHMTLPEVITHFCDEHEVENPELRWILENYGTKVDNEGLSYQQIEENNLTVQRLRQRLLDDWLSVSAQCFSNNGSETNLNITGKTIRATSLLRAGNSFDHYSFLPSFRAGEWVVFCSVPDCPGKSIIWQPFRRSAAIDHFRTHGLELTKDQILDLFGYQIIQDVTRGGRLRRERVSSQLPQLPGVSSTSISENKTSSALRVSFTSSGQSDGRNMKAPSTRAMSMDLDRHESVKLTRRRESPAKSHTRRQCLHCQSRNRRCNGALPSCARCLNDNIRCIYASTGSPERINCTECHTRLEEIGRRGLCYVCRRRNSRRHTARLYSSYSGAQMRELCVSRGINLADMPKRGSTFWMKWRLVEDDIRAERATGPL